MHICTLTGCTARMLTVLSCQFAVIANNYPFIIGHSFKIFSERQRVAPEKYNSGLSEQLLGFSSFTQIAVRSENSSSS